MPWPYTNYAVAPNDLTNAAWAKTTGVTITANSVTAPDGTLTADTIAYSGGGVSGDYRVYQNNSAIPPGESRRVAVWLRAAAPVSVVRLTASGNAVYLNCAITTTWQRFVVDALGDGFASEQIAIGSTGVTPFTIYAWGARLWRGTTFPRTWLPNSSTIPVASTGILTDAWSGRVQRRAVTRLAARWKEGWPPLPTKTASVQAFLALVNQYYRLQTLLDVDHQVLRTQLGVGTGGANVGFSAGGSSVATVGWDAPTPALKAGDVIRIEGVPTVLTLTADAPVSAGSATLYVDPPIPAAYAPAVGAAIDYNATPGFVRYSAMIETLELGEVGTDGFLRNFAVGFREVWS